MNRQYEELQEQREARLAVDRESKKRGCVEESPEQRVTRLSAERESKKKRRVEESQEQRENKLAALRDNAKRKRAEESQEQRENYRLAFRYSPVDDYSLNKCVQIGTMSKICPYCKALKFNGETMGMYCASRKVKLPQLAATPEPLKTLLTGTTSESKRFLSNIRKYNSCFQMTSFGAQIENQDQFIPTLKVKGKIYHRAGSFLTFSGENHKFLQLYFISDSNSELNARCGMSPDVERTIVSQLQHLFCENDDLVHLFKTAIDLMPTDTHKIVISADKTPNGEHVRRYNALTIDEVAKERTESVPRNQKNSKETGLRLIEKERTESVPRNQKNSKETGLRLIEKERTESVPRNYQSNAEADLLLKEKVKKESVPRNYKNSKKSGLLLIEKVRKESVPRNHKNSKKSGLLLIEKVRKESVPRNQNNLKVIAWHSGTTQSMIIA